jgi:prepilin-type N-terminal cleavage/methylation domain-containing protein
MNRKREKLQQTTTRPRGGSVPLWARAVQAGFSMTEMVITVSVIGVIATILIPAMTGVVVGSQEALANQKLEVLNQGLDSYADELTVVLDLQYRNPDANRAPTGAPFVIPEYRPSPSSSTADYRIMWTGYRFKLIRPGQSGTGIKVAFDGSDIGTPFVFPPNYSSSGR